jgi:hypothetical protein
MPPVHSHTTIWAISVFGERIALLLALTALVAFGQENTPAVSSIEAAIRSKQYEQAVAICRSALALKPAGIRIWTLEAPYRSDPEPLAGIARSRTTRLPINKPNSALQRYTIIQRIAWTITSTGSSRL